jgi:hypothetical protein
MLSRITKRTKMKRISKVYILILLLSCSLVKADELPVIDPVVSANKALDFGIWRVYNEGARIFIIDSNRSYYLQVKPTQKSIIVNTPDATYTLVDNGTSGANPPTDTFDNIAQIGLNVESKGQMTNARYKFGNKIFLVNGDTMTIFNFQDEDLATGNVTPRTVIKKYSNGIEHIGTRSISVIDESFSISPPVTGELVAIKPAHTGSWYDPASDGKGGFVNIAEQNGQLVFVVSWFDYNEDGTQMWLIGSSALLEPGATTALVPVQVTQKDVNGVVIKSDWGIFTFEFTSCDTGNLVIAPSSGGPTQTVPLSRLTKIAGLAC